MTDRTQQRHDALARANKVRGRRGIGKAVIANCGTRTTSYPELVAILNDPPAPLHGTSILDVLEATPGVGSGRARAALNRSRILSSTPVEKIRPGHRQLLAEHLEPHAIRKAPELIRARPLVAAGIMSALVESGLNTGQVAHWFATPRHQLDGRTPKQALLDGQPGDPQAVLDLARADALELRTNPTSWSNA